MKPRQVEFTSWTFYSFLSILEFVFLFQILSIIPLNKQNQILLPCNYLSYSLNHPFYDFNQSNLTFVSQTVLY